MLIDTRGKERTRVHCEPAQTGVIVPLQRMLEASGLILVCPRCLADGGSHVQGDVSVAHAVWRLECACTVRVLERKDAAKQFDADGDLVASADTVLQPLSLAVRCPEPQCVRHPLDISRTPNGVEVRCRCAKTRFQVLSPASH